jgi:hypothetical protein
MGNTLFAWDLGISSSQRILLFNIDIFLIQKKELFIQFLQA